MLVSLSQRLLPVLQLTRMALVFTAISNTQATLLLQARHKAGPGASVLPWLMPRQMLAMVVISTALYGFGMALNDIIDRRRDRQLAAHRPLPSGRVGIITAYVICACLALAALLGGAYLARAYSGGWLGLALVVWTMLLIVFYDVAGKYLVAAGLLTLGLIRFFHAIIPAPHIPLLWHPLLMLDHVVILSTFAYAWEEKRPPLTRIHYWGVGGGLAAINLFGTAAYWWRTRHTAAGLWLRPELVLPVGAAVIFILLAVWIAQRSRSSRAAGQSIMMWGLMWLIVYDAAFVAAYVSPLPAGMLLALLPLAWLSVQLMRWWSKLLTLPQAPGFRRIETPRNS